MDETVSPDFEASSFGGPPAELTCSNPVGAIASYLIKQALRTNRSDVAVAVHSLAQEYYQPATAKLGDCRSADRARNDGSLPSHDVVVRLSKGRGVRRRLDPSPRRSHLPGLVRWRAQ